MEVLLQRTRAETVAKFYPVFFGRFTGWVDITSASIEELEQHFKPIGLWNRRARSMRALAEYSAARGGLFPSDPVELAKIPAVGQYVQNAILLFQHGDPHYVPYLHLQDYAQPQGRVFGRRATPSIAIGRAARKAAGFVPRLHRHEWKRRAA